MVELQKHSYPEPEWTPAPSQGSGWDLHPRNIALYIVLSIVTCGFFALYWLYTLAADLRELSGDPDATPPAMVLLLAIVTCSIYSLYWCFVQGEWIDSVRMKQGLSVSHAGVLYIVLSCCGLGIVAMALMQNEINRMIHA